MFQFKKFGGLEGLGSIACNFLSGPPSLLINLVAHVIEYFGTTMVAFNFCQPHSNLFLLEKTPY